MYSVNPRSDLHAAAGGPDNRAMHIAALVWAIYIRVYRLFSTLSILQSTLWISPWTMYSGVDIRHVGSRKCTQCNVIYSRLHCSSGRVESGRSFDKVWLHLDNGRDGKTALIKELNILHRTTHKYRTPCSYKKKKEKRKRIIPVRGIEPRAAVWKTAMFTITPCRTQLIIPPVLVVKTLLALRSI